MVLPESIVPDVTTGHNAHHIDLHRRFNDTFFVGPPAGGTASGKDKAEVFDAITAALASGLSSAMILFAGGSYDVGDLEIVLPKWGGGNTMLTFFTPYMAELNFSVDRGAGTFAVRGDGLDTDLYFHHFSGVWIKGPGARGTVGQPPVNIIGGGPTLMSGMKLGRRMKCSYGGVSGFRSGVQMNGDHITLTQWNTPDNYFGLYFAQPYTLSGDVILDNCDLGGNLMASIAVSPTSIAIYAMHKGHLGFSPYWMYCEAGRTSGSGLAGGGILLNGTSIEFCGNGFIYDPDQFARIQGLRCEGVGSWSVSASTYRIPASAAAPWINVRELSDTSFSDGMPSGGIAGAYIDGALFDVTSQFRMESNTWKASYDSCVAAGQPWMLTTVAPKINLRDKTNDSIASVRKAAQTVTAGQTLEHNGQATFSVRPWGHFGAVKTPYAGVALNAATGGDRTGVVCVRKGDRIPVQVDSAAASSVVVVPSTATAGKATGIAYDGTNTGTNGRPVIGMSYFGNLPTGGGTVDVQLTE